MSTLQAFSYGYCHIYTSVSWDTVPQNETNLMHPKTDTDLFVSVIYNCDTFYMHRHCNYCHVTTAVNGSHLWWCVFCVTLCGGTWRVLCDTLRRYLSCSRSYCWTSGQPSFPVDILFTLCRLDKFVAVLYSGLYTDDSASCCGRGNNVLLWWQ